MAKSLFWKGKVARSIAIITVTALTVLHLNAQSFQSQKITYSCKSASLETVIDDLSRSAGVHFVYSSNKITTSTQVTLSVQNRPIDEVLTQLSQQLNLTFKIQDRYITIKSGNHLPIKNEITFQKVDPAPATASSSEKEHSLTEFQLQKQAEATQVFSREGDQEKYLVKVQPYFAHSVLKNVPIQYVKPTARNLHGMGWFTSVGPVINSYSAGLELQAGLRQAYVVFIPTWLQDDQFHGALGIGTSLRLSGIFSINPVYSFASLKKTETPGLTTTPGVRTPSYQINAATSHHQIKLMLQYSFSNKFNLRAGPTFNQSNTNYQYQPTVTGYTVFNDMHTDPHAPLETGPRQISITNQAQTVPSDVTVNKFWLGWEASFSYRINFK